MRSACHIPSYVVHENMSFLGFLCYFTLLLIKYKLISRSVLGLSLFINVEVILIVRHSITVIHVLILCWDLVHHIPSLFH